MEVGTKFKADVGGATFTYVCIGKSDSGVPICQIETAKTKEQPEAALLKDKATCEWHVCVLNDRIWSGVSPWFKSKNWARKWAIHNGYKLVKTA